VSTRVRLLIVTGSMGAGKTTALGEASDVLAQREFVHAALDFDGLALGRFPANMNRREMAIANLVSIWRNFREAGTTALLLAAAVETRTELDQLRSVVRPDETVCCRLRASIATMEARVRVREPGILQPHFVRRVRDLDAVLDAAAIEDFWVANEDRSVTEVAREMLVRAHWLEDAGSAGHSKVSSD